MDEFYRAVEALPQWLARPLRQLPEERVQHIHELRLRTGCTLALNIGGGQQPAEALEWLPPALRQIRLTPSQMEEILFSLCGGSVHTHQAELAQGFVTLPNGCRAGIGGQFVIEPEQGVVLQQLRSVALRVARQRTVLLPETLKTALAGNFVGALLIGEPDSGKTTLLRSIACFLALQRRSVVVLDERRELFPMPKGRTVGRGVPLDVLAGLPKALAIPMALRTLSPQILLLDELGSMDEVEALRQGLFAGVDLIATIHASSLAEARRRPQVRALEEDGALRVLVQLKGRGFVGEIAEVKLL